MLVQAGDDLVTAHAWLPGGFHAACTAGGRLLIQQEGDEVALLSHGLGVLTAMAALPQGLVVGDSAGGVAIFALSTSQRRRVLCSTMHVLWSLGELGCRRSVSRAWSFCRRVGCGFTHS